MSLAGVLFVSLGGLLAILAIWMVVSTVRKERAAFAALADHRGWDHQPNGPSGLEPLARRVIPQEDNPVSFTLLDYFAGPTMVGPFRLNRIRSTRTGGRPKNSEQTVIHVRTPLSCPGLHVEPSQRFRAGSNPEAGAERADRFARSYHAHGKDPEFTSRALDPATRNFVAAPRRTIRFDWKERDLVIGFPFAVRTPHAVEALVSWSTALASHLNEAHAFERPRAAPEYSTHYTTTLRGSKEQHETPDPAH